MQSVAERLRGTQNRYYVYLAVLWFWNLERSLGSFPPRWVWDGGALSLLHRELIVGKKVSWSRAWPFIMYSSPKWNPVISSSQRKMWRNSCTRVFWSGCCRRSLGQREVGLRGILAAGGKWEEDTGTKRKNREELIWGSGHFVQPLFLACWAEPNAGHAPKRKSCRVSSSGACVKKEPCGGGLAGQPLLSQ